MPDFNSSRPRGASYTGAIDRENSFSAKSREQGAVSREQRIIISEQRLYFDINFCIFNEGMSITLEKSRKFAIKVYNLYKHLCDEKHEYVLAKQLLRSGTSIGANLTEAQYSVSRKEFLNKAAISLKECAETEYWLDLLKETNLLSQTEYDDIIKDCKELLRLLISTTKTVKTRQLAESS
jgi:four helix bundle protein